MCCCSLYRFNLLYCSKAVCISFTLPAVSGFIGYSFPGPFTLCSQQRKYSFRKRNDRQASHVVVLFPFPISSLCVPSLLSTLIRNVEPAFPPETHLYIYWYLPPVSSILSSIMFYLLSLPSLFLALCLSPFISCSYLTQGQAISAQLLHVRKVSDGLQ